MLHKIKQKIQHISSAHTKPAKMTTNTTRLIRPQNQVMVVSELTALVALRKLFCNVFCISENFWRDVKHLDVDEE